MITRFGILLPGDVLAVNLYTGQPSTYAHKRSAARAMLSQFPDYLATMARVVRVDVDMSTKNPTYVVHR